MTKYGHDSDYHPSYTVQLSHPQTHTCTALAAIPLPMSTSVRTLYNYEYTSRRLWYM